MPLNNLIRIETSFRATLTLGVISKTFFLSLILPFLGPLLLDNVSWSPIFCLRYYCGVEAPVSLVFAKQRLCRRSSTSPCCCWGNLARMLLTRNLLAYCNSLRLVCFSSRERVPAPKVLPTAPIPQMSGRSSGFPQRRNF